jgi:hypothetical protein
LVAVVNLAMLPATGLPLEVTVPGQVDPAAQVRVEPLLIVSVVPVLNVIDPGLVTATEVLTGKLLPPPPPPPPCV